MSDTDAAGLPSETLDALETQIAAARATGDDALANRLYQQQQGVEGAVDPYSAADSDHDAGTVEHADIEGTGMADYVPWDALTEAEQGEAFDSVMARSDPAAALRELQTAWPGAELQRNVEFAWATVAAIPGSAEALQVLEAVGIADHPALIQWLASAGRLMAGVSGDPTTVPKGGPPMADTDAIEDAIDALQEQIEQAQARHDTGRANRLYQQQLDLQRSMPGGSGPAVGHGGRTA